MRGKGWGDSSTGVAGRLNCGEMTATSAGTKLDLLSGLDQ